MPDSIKSKPEPEKSRKAAGRLVPVPGTIGFFALLVTALAFVAGSIRNELALTLLGTVFITVLVYCFIGVFLVGVIHRRKGISLLMTIVTENISAGKQGELLIKTPGGGAPPKNYFWRLPAILVRCELCLETADERVIRHFADPCFENYSSFPVRERGAYFGKSDSFVITDAPGFFRLSFSVPQTAGPRLLALPAPAEEPIPISIRSGGTEQRSEFHYRKSDELTDHRPYVPGDDPRRINWKLYSHAPLGELFVREGEPKPPPHSRLLVLIDTEADQSLFTADESRCAVDLLCENALAAALEFSDHGMDILIGYTGGKIMGGGEGSPPLDKAELAAALALPAAIRWPRSSGILPLAPMDRAVLVLALPRENAEASALDNFLKNRQGSSGSEASPATDIVFICRPELSDAAGVCVNHYNRKPGVRAAKAIVSAAAEITGGVL